MGKALLQNAPLVVLWGYMKLQITNIDRKLTEDELKAIYAEFGTIEECTLVMDAATGKSKGFGFVVIAEEASALRAVEKTNGRFVNGVKIKVKSV